MLSAKVASRSRRLLIVLLLFACVHGSHNAEFNQRLTCYCNECGEGQDSCETNAHVESTCFMVVERVVVNNTFQHDYRYGCMSGSDNDLFSLQCKATGLRHKNPLQMVCCNSNDFCNRDLELNGTSDPRWSETYPEEQQSDLKSTLAIIWPWIVVLLILIVITKIYRRYKVNKDTTESINSVRAFVYDEPIKSESISDSDHTYTISDKLSPDISLAMTQADITSGVGTRLLELRSIARAVKSGSIQPIGHGRFGRVFRGTFNDCDLAVKAFQPIDQESWAREAKILSLLNHENIVRYIASEICTVSPSQSTETWMFLEFCSYGSLCDFLDQNEVLGTQQAIKILYCIIEGLNYLHEDFSTGGGKPPIAHRDIKSKNILMRSPEVCCIADFGHSVIKVNDNMLDFGNYGCHRLQVGTVRYLAPEILNVTQALDITQFATFAQADLYQFSLVLWEVCNRTALDVLHPAQQHRLPYDDLVPQNPDLPDMIKVVCEHNYRPPRPPHWQRHPEMSQLSSLMDVCWCANPKSRMGTRGVRKRIKELHDRIPSPAFYHHNNLFDRLKSTEMTL